MNFDYKNMETYHYFIAGGAGLVVIALLLCLFKGRKIKVSAFFATTLGALALGFGIGVITLGAAGYHWEEQKQDEAQAKAAANTPNPKGKKSADQNPNPKKNANAVSAKLQLAALIVKLNQITETPLTINLGDRKGKVAEQLKDLDTKEMLTNEEAETRLKALKETLDKDYATLTAAGLDLDRAGAVGKKEPPANPFTNEANKTALKALQERLAKN